MPDTDRFIIGIDLGTSSAKVGLFSIYGETCGCESEPLPLYLLPNGGAEQDPHDWWNGIRVATQRLLARVTIPRERIVAICASTTGAGTVPIDREGHCLMRAIIWLDTRGAMHTRRVAGGVLAGYNPFKLFRWLRLSGGAPFLSGKDGFGHQLYIKNEYSDVYHRTYKFLDVVDYVDWCLTGKFITTADAVVVRWVTDNRDPARIAYDETLIRWSQIEREKYPDIVPSTRVLGPLLPRVADELGLSRDVQVVAGAFDIPAAAIGSGAAENYAAHLYIGTSSWLATHLPFKKTDLLNAMASVPSALPDRFVLIATQEMAGGNLMWLRDNILYRDDALGARRAPDDFFAALNAAAEQVPPGSRGVIYTPWLFGERAPVDDGWIRAGFHNLSLHNTRADLARAVMEGVALNTRWLLAPVEKFCGRPLNPINIVGGGANSNLWCQIHADVLNRTIRQVKDPVLAGARGAALIASIGLGYIRADEVARCVTIQNEYHPNPAHRALYDQRFAEFVELYKQNRKIHARLNRERQEAVGRRP